MRSANRLHRLSFRLQHLAISRQNKMVLDSAADFAIATARCDREFICGSGPNLKEH